MSKKRSSKKISRRTFIETTGVAVVAAGAAPVLSAQTPARPAAAPAAAAVPPGAIRIDPAVPHSTIRITINGVAQRIDVEDRWTLAELLRDRLMLTGTKIGCDRGECGACTVLLDGKPVYSCSNLAMWADGRTVQTVEGLAKNGTLAPLQAAFVAHDAPQCGFCTSGQLMAAVALHNTTPNPTAEQARAAMVGNICRCSNYNRYIEACVGSSPSSAATISASATSPVAALTTIGHAASRIDAAERASGKATYTRDVHMPGMLFAAVLRSPHPHARIRSIDVSKAKALAGVKAVITHENASVVWGAGSVAGGVQYSDPIKQTTKQKRYAFNNPVRFVGEPVAAVAALDRHAAEEALRLIVVDYETLPFVLDPEEALKPDAPKIWPEGNFALNARNEPQPTSQRRGNPDQGFAGADHVFEDHYSTAFVHNAQMEPRAAVAMWEGDKLTLYTPTGGIANCRTDMARDLGIAPERVRVISEYMGGNFGNKNQNQDADLIAAVLAKEAGAPVKLEMSRKEDFIGMHGRWPTSQYYKVGVKADGTLTAVTLRGYSGMGPYRKNSGAIAGIEIYHCDNAESVVSPVYTNKTVSGNYRGPEFPQGFFGIQSMMDDVASKLKMDPVEFVRRNMVRPTADQAFTNYSLEECIAKGVEAFNWKARWKPVAGSDAGPIKRGAGMSFMAFRSGLGRSSAVIQLDSTGRYTVFVGVTDVGAGAKTTMWLIASEALGVPPSSVNVVWGDTDTCPYSVGESGSRTTIMTGYAVIEAAKDIKKQLAEKGAPAAGGMLIATANPSPTVADRKTRNAFGAHFVEVEADVELGHVRVTKYVAVHDCGRLMNPLTATSQIKGAAVQGIGMALHEDLIYDRRNGQPLTAGYYGDRIATHRDAPEIDVIFIESDDGYGPYGAKSMGESGIVLSPAAVANAVANATGKRMKDLPINRQRVLEALA